MKRQSQTGQAMMELLVGIIAFVVILVGIVTFGEGGYHWLTSMNEAAGMAWGQAISPNSVTMAQSTAPQAFIQTWNNTSGSSPMLQGLGLGYLPGTSTSVLQYNFQDAQVGGSPGAFNLTAKQMLCQSIAGNPSIDYSTYTEPYLRSQPVFAQALQQSGTSGWLIGQSTHVFKLGRIDRGYGTPVDFGSALQALVYGKSSINMQSQVFLPPLSGF